VCDVYIYIIHVNLIPPDNKILLQHVRSLALLGPGDCRDHHVAVGEARPTQRAIPRGFPGESNMGMGSVAYPK
jgi:hypothetical protein